MYNKMVGLDQIQTLEDSREHLEWKQQQERHALLHKIYHSDEGNGESEIWSVGVLAIFEKKEIDQYLSASVELMAKGPIDGAAGKRFVQFVRKSGYKDKPDVRQSTARRTTAIHRSRQLGIFDVLDDLFKIYGNYSSKCNYEDEFGWTHFHVACVCQSEFVVKRFLDNCSELANLRVKETGDAPLHFAWSPGMIELLLRNHADPNLANADGLTPLHVICTRERDEAFRMLVKFFEICRKMRLSVEVNARDKRGETPLHVALRNGDQNSSMRLLNVGGDLTLANADGLTPLHVICQRESNDDPLAKKFLRFCDRKDRTIDIDARDKFGNTPLHLAAFGGHADLIEMLLSRNAKPNLANRDGLTPLHVICKTNRLSLDYQLVTRFFKINEKNRVIVDVRDKKGRTPLQWAVANIQPQVMEYLFDCGADPLTFVFPTEKYFGKRLRPWKSHSSRHFKLGLAAGAMIIVEYLENNGHKLELSQTLMIMKLFAKYELFAKSTENHWYNDEEFKRQAQTITMTDDQPGLSLYELISLQPTEAEKRIALKDYLECAHDSKLEKLPEGCADDCASHLCEKASRRFFRRSALYPLWELVRYRLPILCCHMIIENLPNEDVRNIVEAYSLS